MLILKIILGFILLILGANILVEGAVKIAKKIKISTMVISMTIIAIGTSLPEFAIAIVSSIKGNNIALSNNVGGIIANIGLALGLSAAIFSVKIGKFIPKEVLKILILQMILCLFLLTSDYLGKVHGLIFIIAFVFYMLYIIKNAKNIVSIEHEEKLIEDETKFIDKTKIYNNSIITSIVFIMLGILCITFGGDMVVNSAVDLSRIYGLKEAFIASTIVSFGTTLPEITTGLVAAKKKEHDIIIGNVVGSGISNILLIVGTSVIIKPIEFSSIILFQIGFMMLLTLLVYIFSKRGIASKGDGIILIFTYLLFILSSMYISK